MVRDGVRRGLLIALCVLVSTTPAVPAAAGSGPVVVPGAAVAGAAAVSGAVAVSGSPVALAAPAGAVAPGAEGGPVPGVAPPSRVPGPAVAHRELTVGPDGPAADVIDVDLTAPGVRIGLLTAPSVSARSSVPGMADRAGARAAINGDFFDIGRSNAPAGPQVRDGHPLSSGVPVGRRASPPVPGAGTDTVLTVGTDGRARIERLALVASVTAGPAASLRRVGVIEPASTGTTLPVVALNQFAVPVDGIGIVTPEWGAADRARTLCGSDTDRTAPCAPDRIEVLVSDGVVRAVRPPGAGPLAPGETVLLGRDRGATALRALRPGDPVTIRYRLDPDGDVPPVTAIGAVPILRDGHPVGGLDDRTRAPRSAVGISDDGRRLFLLTVDGREPDGTGVTLTGLAGLLAAQGATDGVTLDGGGSSALVYRAPGAAKPSVVNTPAEGSTRLVPNALGVFAPG